jgi:hypothetical protein
MATHTTDPKQLLQFVQQRLPEAHAQMQAQTTTALEEVGRVFEQLGLTEEQMRLLVPSLLIEIRRRLPEFFVAAALIAALPLLAARFRRRYAQNANVTAQDAEDLSHNAVLKILAALNGSRPRGNVGAWVATIREHVLLDHWRWVDRHGAA